MDQMKTRAQVDAQYKWKLEDMYANDGVWEQDFAASQDAIKSAAAARGTLSSASGLHTAMVAFEKAEYLTQKLYTYARMRRDEDNGCTTYQALVERAMSRAIKLSAETAFFTPELLTVGAERIQGFYAQEPQLEKYRRSIDQQLRMQAHTLSPKEESLLAQAGEMADAPDTIYSMLTDADFTFGTVKNEEGKDVELTQGRFISLLESRNRDVRKETYDAYYAQYKRYTNTIAATYAASVKKDVFFAKARGYASTREQSLFNSEIPEGVYDALIEAVHRHLPAMHKYLKLRKKMLGVEKLHYYDIYTSIVPEVKMGAEYPEAFKMVADALAPLGETYVGDMKNALTDGWVDVYENAGKTSGAYSWGMYGTHPYVLLNYEDTLDNLFTLAHELGHAMHTFYSDQNQSFVNSQYPLFLAEIASTTNEAIVLHGLKQTLTRKEQLMALCNYQLEQIRGTVYRQTLFAEFEREVHAMALRGEALTAEAMTNIYRELNLAYYDGVEMDDNICYEWMRIPHFYRSFYVYQYATGYSAAVAFSRKILSGDADARDSYLGFLSAGSSKPALDILRDAGVDMESPQPVEECLKTFEETLDQLIKLLEEE